MFTIRSYTMEDFPILQKRYSASSQEKIEYMIKCWDLKLYDGKYFEMFAIVVDGEVAGPVSLYQHTSMAISCGIEVFSAFRRLGYASIAVSLALEHAKSLGYKIAVASVRKNNIASIALHKKLKFEIDHEYINSKGNEVYFFLKAIY